MLYVYSYCRFCNFNNDSKRFCNLFVVGIDKFKCKLCVLCIIHKVNSLNENKEVKWIRITAKLHHWLNMQGRKGESYEDVLRRLLRLPDRRSEENL